EVVRGEEFTPLRGRTEKPYPFNGVPLHVHPDGRLLASGHADGVRLWDIEGGEEIALLPGYRTYSVLFHPHGDALFTSGEAGVFLWPLTGLRKADRLRVGPAQSLGLPPTRIGAEGMRTASLSADGETLGLTERGRRHRALTWDRKT